MRNYRDEVASALGAKRATSSAVPPLHKYLGHVGNNYVTGKFLTVKCFCIVFSND